MRTIAGRAVRTREKNEREKNLFLQAANGKTKAVCPAYPSSKEGSERTTMSRSTKNRLQGNVRGGDFRRRGSKNNSASRAAGAGGTQSTHRTQPCKAADRFGRQGSRDWVSEGA